MSKFCIINSMIYLLPDAETVPTRNVSIILEIFIDFENAFNDLSSKESLAFISKLEPQVETFFPYFFIVTSFIQCFNTQLLLWNYWGISADIFHRSFLNINFFSQHPKLFVDLTVLLKHIFCLSWKRCTKKQHHRPLEWCKSSNYRKSLFNNLCKHMDSM